MKPKGFTLVELLIVIAIIAILVTIVIIAINPITVLHTTQDTKRRTEMNQLKVSLQLYFNDNRRYPDPSTEFGNGGTVPFVNTYMKQLPTGYTYYYGTDATHSTYAVGVPLNIPSVAHNDSGSYTKCSTDVGKVTASTPSPPTTANSDYFVCPD